MIIEMLIWSLALDWERVRNAVKRIFAGFIIVLFTVLSVSAQKAAPPASLPPPATQQSAEFLQAADEVLAEMSKLLSLPILSPLKKSLRSREEIKAYLLQKMKEDKDADKRYADQKSMEKFGLLPKDYPLEQTLVKVLTEQIAGLYDSDSKEFFIANWNTEGDVRMVMAHELTHAMLDYILRGKGSIRDLGVLDPAMLMGDPDSSPELAKAPKVLQDELLFPYTAGTTFTQRVLKASSGWPDFHKVYENPPVSTQQIMHPDLYLQGVVPPKITLPDTAGVLPADWKKLDENNMGEFGLLEILKQFLAKDRSAALAATWSADRYAIFENQKNKRTLLIFRVRLGSEADAARFFGAYSELLESKYDMRTNLMRRPNFFSFDTPEDGVFLRCVASDCLVLEGSNRVVFDHLTMEMGWPGGPIVPIKPGEPRVKVTLFPGVTQFPVSFRAPVQ